MKKSLIFTVVLLLGLSITTVSAQSKYALVIGNGNYTNISKLNNAVNDANDMTATLQSLGFTVDKVLNGNLDQMENAITRLKNRLSVSRNSYGFFFYAGHGVQSNGVNYLIPVGVDIRNENSLRERAVSIQLMLAELNEAGNELNIVVLDACRDNPFGWARSGNRGLSAVSNQPADSIIMFATSAGSTASDGSGKNGLFTSQLLKNLKTSGLEVSELLRLTGADVVQTSNGQQIPAVYNQFFGTAYLGTAPAGVQPTSSAQTSATPPTGNIHRAPGVNESSITIQREKNLWVGTLAKYAVLIDGVEVFSLSNGDSDYAIISNGNHTIEIKQMGIRWRTVQVNVNSESVTYLMSVSSTRVSLTETERQPLGAAAPAVAVQPSASPTPTTTTPTTNTTPAPAVPTPSTSTQATTTPVEPSRTTETAILIHVEGGTFQMGSSNGDRNERPVHQVTVSSFYISKYEVTQAEYEAVMGNNPSRYKEVNRPVENVSWLNAIEYCNKLSIKEGLTPVYSGSGNDITWNQSANGYRLPTEAEWEYAARGGNNVSLIYEYSGSNNIDTVAWYKSNTRRGAQPVGTKAPNSLGLYDMSGNVCEWCWDWFGNYAGESQINPKGASSGRNRVIRGGSWNSAAQYSRTTSRGNIAPTAMSDQFGFRVVRN
jgi:formylglycine-generating enzyme required for sulfatase activity